MAKITFKERYGADLFNYLEAVALDASTAKNWALESFVLVDGNLLTIEQIAKLKNDVYIKLSEKVFSLDVASLVTENNTGIEYKNFKIKRRLIHRDFITEIQALRQNLKNKSNVNLIKIFINKFFEIDNIDILPYELVAFMFGEVNTFLQQLTEPANELYIDELFVDDSGSTVGTGVADMV
jgi:hypothetical protein